MHDVDILPRQHFPEIVIALHLRFHPVEGLLQMVAVHIAYCQQPGGGIDLLEVIFAHAADADHRLGQLIAGRSEAAAPSTWRGTIVKAPAA